MRERSLWVVSSEGGGVVGRCGSFQVRVGDWVGQDGVFCLLFSYLRPSKIM
jgi:hypothetical protein